VAFVVLIVSIGVGIRCYIKKSKNQNKPITIQSSSHGLMKKMIIKSQSVLTSMKSGEDPNRKGNKRR